MKVVFVSNYFNHHQQAFCDEMVKHLDDNFIFIATSVMREDRKQLGYGVSSKPDYVLEAHLSENDYINCCEIINTADVVIAGSVSERMLKKRIQSNLLTFRYQERLFKSNISFARHLINSLHWLVNNPKNKNIHLLCASAYTSYDYSKIGLFKTSAYKWGYFPQTNTYDISELIRQKNKTKILWCGRLIPYKHPEYAIEIASRLKNKGYDFSLDFIGIGELESNLKIKVKEYNLENFVTFLGSKKPEKVREHMEKSSIFIFTSDFEEGWGAVLNEAMNSGCAVVASHAIGSVPFLLDNKINGLIFENGNVDNLFVKVKYLLDNPDETIKLGINAYNTISKEWNAQTAAERLLEMIREINLTGQCKLFSNGPCSKAEILRNNWFKDE